MCSAGGRAVLRVVDRERRQAHCAEVGQHLVARLQRLAERHDLIGDVRGAGLMLGVEMVKDRKTKVGRQGLGSMLVGNGLWEGQGGELRGMEGHVAEVPRSIDEKVRCVVAINVLLWLYSCAAWLRAGGPAVGGGPSRGEVRVGLRGRRRT